MKALLALSMVCMVSGVLRAAHSGTRVCDDNALSIELPKCYGGLSMPLLHYFRGHELLRLGEIRRSRRQFWLAADQFGYPDISIEAQRMLMVLDYPELDKRVPRDERL